MTQGVYLFLAFLFLYPFVSPELEEIKMTGFYIHAVHFLVVQEASPDKLDDTESQSHRIVKVGKDFQNHQVQPLTKHHHAN